MSTSTIDYDALAAQHGGKPAAVDYDALAQSVKGGKPAAPSNTPASAPPSTLSRVGKGALNLGSNVLQGLGESGISLMSTGDEFARKHLPAFLTNSNLGFGPPANLEHVHALAHPDNTTQAVGKGLGDAAQFMIPGGAEEKAVAMAPKALRPIAKIGASALSAGAVNKAQGGDFKTGAAAGGVGAGIGAGLEAAAPSIAETALKIPKAMRAFGKTPGKAALEETSGIRPETVAASAQSRMGQLTPQLEAAADAASQRPNAARGLLTSGTEQIPLPNAPDVRGRLSKPVILQSNRAMPREFPGYGVNPPASPRFTDGIPGEGNEIPPEGAGQIPERFNGMRAHEYVGEVPGTRGGAGQPQGVLLRPPSTAGSPPPLTLPNRSASLGPARSIIGTEMGSAANQNAEGLHNQLGKMQDFLGTRFGTGEQIPANVTPRELLDLKRGFNEEHLRWNPEMHDRALSTGRRAYGALDSELDRTVPEAAGLNQRISSLIPVARRAESISREAPVTQRVAGRLGAHTGALALGGIGAAEGRREGGTPGMIAGGLAGLVAPELVASPEGQMALARTLYKSGSLRPLVAGALQADRKRGNQ